MAQVLDLLPVELWLITTEMPTAGCLLESGLSQFKIPHDHSRSQVKIPVNNPLQILITKSYDR